MTDNLQMLTSILLQFKPNGKQVLETKDVLKALMSLCCSVMHLLVNFFNLML